MNSSAAASNGDSKDIVEFIKFDVPKLDSQNQMKVDMFVYENVLLCIDKHANFHPI